MLLRQVCCAFAAALALAAGAHAADVDQSPVILVASPQLGDFYRGTVLFVRPIGNGGHLGFIVNRPTKVTMRQIFPEHVPSQKVTEPVYLGGPLHVDAVYAVVQRVENPGGRTLVLAPDLFLVMDSKTVDSVIEQNRDRTRFFVGLVVWRPGELAHELSTGFWSVLDADSAMIFRKSTHGMWEELVDRSRRML